MKTLFTIITLSFLLPIKGFSQSAINASGGDVSAAEGSVSYSIGSLFSSGASINGSSLSGPQIPNEFFDGNAPIGDYPTPPGSGDALSFDGSNEYILADQNFNQSGSFSCEFWVKSTNDNVTAILSTGTTTGGLGVGGTANVFIGDGMTSSLANELIGVSLVQPGFVLALAYTTPNRNELFDGEWHHVAVAFNGSSSYSIFLDGISKPVSYGSGAPNYSFSVAGANYGIIGARIFDSNLELEFEGELDELRLWSSELNNTEIRGHMCQKDLSTHPQLANLAAYYRFDDGVGSTVLQDISGNGNNGTLTNMDPATDWVTSGAPIGDQSVQGYGSASVSLSNGTSFTADNFTGSPDGVHVYRVNEAPNNTDLPLNYSGLENDEYYGVFLAGGSSPSYDATWDYSSNTNIDGAGNESEARIASRADNAAGAFSDIFAQSLDDGANTLTVPNQSGTEYIAGFAPSPSYPTPPGSGEALSFDGVDDYVVSSGISFGQTVSAEAWVNLPAPLIGLNNIIGACDDPNNNCTGGDYKFFVFRIHDDGSVQIGLSYLTPSTRMVYLRTSPGVFPTGEWVHLAMNIDAANNSGEIFINGEAQTLINQSIGSGSGIYNATNIGIGTLHATFPGGTGFRESLKGTIDEVRIYNALLTQSEIRDHMCQKDLSSHPQLANLAAYYRFDDGTGSSTLQDISGNGNNGTLTNMDPATDWVTSGAPIGDQSAQGYGTASVSLSDGTSMTVDNLTGSPEGVHVYRVDEAPNDVTVPASYSALETSEYYGVHLVGGTNPTYSATFDYTGNANIDGQANESAALLASRSNNAAGSFENIATQTLDAAANTIIAPNQTGTEYIPGFNQIVDTDGDGDPDSTDPCPTNAFATLDDCGICTGGDTGAEPCGAASLVLTPSATTVEECQEFTLLVSIETNSEINLADAFIDFDNTQLEVFDVTAPDDSPLPVAELPNEIFGIDLVEINTSGVIRYGSGDQTDEELPDSDFDFFKVWFRATGSSGTTSIVPDLTGIEKSIITAPTIENGIGIAVDILANGSANTVDITLSPDASPPVPDEETLTLVFDECSVASIAPPTATDACDGTIEGVPNVSFPITAQGVTLVTWTFTDANNNTSSQTQQAVLSDTSDPEITCATGTPFEVLINQTSNVFLISDDSFDATASDNCGIQSLTHDGGGISGPDNTTLDGWSFPPGNYTITFTATDVNTRTKTCSIELNVSNLSLTGTVSVNPSCGAIPMRVQAYDANTTNQVGGDLSTSIATNGAYSLDLSGLLPGTYDFLLKPERMLQQKSEDVNLSSSATIDLTNIPLGDIDELPPSNNGDNQIDMNDLSYLIGFYNQDQNTGGYAFRPDLNCDSQIDALDLSILLFFYNQMGGAAGGD